MLLSAGGPLPFRLIVVMWVEASSPYTPCDWEVGVADRIYRIDRADEFDVTHSGFFSSTRLLPPFFAFGVSLFLSVMSLKD